jgi:hypothetical protein
MTPSECRLCGVKFSLNLPGVDTCKRCEGGYYKVYEWFGRDCIEWIVCKECQKRLTREGAVRPFFQRSPSAKRDTRQAPYPRGWRPGRTTRN